MKRSMDTLLFTAIFAASLFVVIPGARGDVTIKIVNSTLNADCIVDVVIKHDLKHSGGAERAYIDHGQSHEFKAGLGVLGGRGWCFDGGPHEVDLKDKCFLTGKETKYIYDCLPFGFNADFHIRKGSDGLYHFHRE